MKPLLYTFRRCPYAIRARLAIVISGVEVECREVDLRNKPQAMLDCSPKGTVPVLKLTDGRVIDESLDIMRWALCMHDPYGWIDNSEFAVAEVSALVDENDGPFKRLLDGYKYPSRNQADAPEQAAKHCRDEGSAFLRKLSSRLAVYPYLMGATMSLPDAAIFPFVRQFANVDKTWFDQAFEGPLAAWLDGLMNSHLFLSVMRKDLKGSSSEQPFAS